MTTDDNQVLQALESLESLSSSYSYELRYLSKRIRFDIWKLGKNSTKLAFFLNKFNSVFRLMNNIIGDDTFFSLNTVIEYVNCLAKYSVFYCNQSDPNYFNALISDIQLVSSERIIEQQWKDVHSSEDGNKSFIEIFDDIFTHAINIHKDRFFHELSDSDILCRVVNGWGHNTDRFIPYPSKTNNRWNPQGRQFLYLSFGKKEEPYSSELSLNEYICLEEYRAKANEKYSFCHFAPTIKGNILDLSYNDKTMTQIKSIVDIYYNETVQNMVTQLLSEPNAQQKYQNKRKLKKSVTRKIQENPIDKGILEESYAKQYLKMICSCIYKKVDETDESKKEIAYKSFHILSEYLESKGVTGIIYPCTRTNKVQGKNLVLFNVNDAIPIADSIREYYYKQ